RWPLGPSVPPPGGAPLPAAGHCQKQSRGRTERHAEATCKLSLGIAKRVRRLDLAPHWPDMPKGADGDDWLAQGHSPDELVGWMAGALDYVTANPEPPPASEPSADADDSADAEITRLAKLKLIEYGQQRKAAAEKLGVPVLILERVVRDERVRLG